MIITNQATDHSNFIQKDLEEAYRDNPLNKRLYLSIQTTFNAGRFYLSMIPRISPFENPDCCHPHKEKTWTWKENNEGLFVVVHGLKGSPIFSSLVYRENIKKMSPGKYEVRLPYVVKKGSCSLEEAAEPILAMVKDYVEKNPGKPVNLIGTSNGGRIIGYIESHLRDKDVHIRVTGIAGVFFGSNSMNILRKIGLAPLVLDKECLKELQTGSKTARDLISAMQASVTTGTRSFKFYATNGDLYIPNFSSCFPAIAGAEHELILGEDHVSLGTAICPQVLREHFLWMDSLE